MTQIVPYQEIERMGTAIAQSKLFGAKTPQEAIALMLVAQSEGLHPARAAIEYHIIQGRPALKADAMLARFQAQGGSVKWTCYTDEKVSGVFSHPQGGSIEVDWTIDRAKQAGVYGKNPTWKSYPRAMLRARCISEGIRTVFPGVSVGVYTPEEVQDFEPQEKDVTPKPAAAPMPEKVKEHGRAMRGEKSAKNHAPQPIEGTATPVSDPSFPAEAGDLSGIGNNKPDIETMRKLVAAFASLGYDIPALEKEYGKPLDDWTADDVPEAREVFRVLKEKQREQPIEGEVI